ncbi:MoaD/ThiS family protein [Ruania zhangjianzhongii]|uniref:MoaD/ThiS family protein n=1 Tax=Ruania zhangjianzhongii TaxID=2603206 RepID=UPI0011CC9998|nr:MoaD/ThiS family protein [Ruania zhangjianzhongii]
MTEVRYFAAAAEAAGRQGESLAAGTIGELRALMVDRHGEQLERVLTTCSLLVDGVAAEPDTTLGATDVVDVLPPFAGG